MDRLTQTNELELRNFIREAIDKAKKVKYYHASPRRFRYGDILTGDREGGAGYRHSNICLTTSPLPHETIITQALEDNWFVYEIEPVDEDINPNPNFNHELQCRAARVVKVIGRARAIAKHRTHGSGVPSRYKVHDKLRLDSYWKKYYRDNS